MIYNFTAEIFKSRKFMAENTKKKEGQEAAEGQQPTARERYRSRYQAAHPDMNLDDEDAFYEQANSNLDELENFRESNRQLGEAMDKTPLLGGLVLAAKEGENPFVYLAENIGPDMDIRELANNPDFGKQMGDALGKFQESLAADAKRKEEIGTNMQQSFDALKQLQQEKNLSNEDAIALVKKLFGETDENGEQTDPGIIGNAAMGIVPKEVWEAVLKAQNYDSDIASAADKARATAMNERMQNGLRNFGSGVPSLSGGGVGRGERQPKKRGGFADWGEDGV